MYFTSSARGTTPIATPYCGGRLVINLVDVHADDLVHHVPGNALHDDGAHLARVERVLLQVAEHEHVFDRGLKRLRNVLLENFLLKVV